MRLKDGTYEAIKERVVDLLDDYGVTRYPLDVYALVRQIGIRLIPYSQLDGESRSAYVYRCNISGFEGLRFVKVGKGLHLVDEDDMVLEKATGKMNRAVDWMVDVKRA